MCHLFNICTFALLGLVSILGTVNWSQKLMEMRKYKCILARAKISNAQPLLILSRQGSEMCAKESMEILVSDPNFDLIDTNTTEVKWMFV